MVNIAVLWDDEVEHDGDEPFVHGYLNEAYELFSGVAQGRGAEVYIARFDRYQDAVLTEAFVYSDGWQKVEDIEIDVVFDKYRFDDETVKVKKDIESRLPVLNLFELEKVCKDKLETYRRFPSIVPETRVATRENLEDMLEEREKVVFKPRYSFGGKGIEFLDSANEFEEPDDAENYVLQAFIDAGSGITELGVEGVHDLRIYMLNGEPVGAYVRIPESGLKSNIMQGGTMRFVDIEDVPGRAMEIAEEVAEEFEKYEPYLFALDTVFDREGNVWVMELNSKPGLAFYGDDEARERKMMIMERLLERLVDMA